MMAMELHKKPCAELGLSLNVTLLTLKALQVITNQTLGAKKCQRRFVLPIIAIWFR